MALPFALKLRFFKFSSFWRLETDQIYIDICIYKFQFKHPEHCYNTNLVNKLTKNPTTKDPILAPNWFNLPPEPTIQLNFKALKFKMH